MLNNYLTRAKDLHRHLPIEISSDQQVQEKCYIANHEESKTKQKNYSEILPYPIRTQLKLFTLGMK